MKGEFPMGGKCQTMDTVYDCGVILPETQKIYFSLAEEKQKQRCYNDKK